VLTEAAYEKAHRLGMKLMRATPENPPSAPVRPYIAAKQDRPARAPAADPVAAPKEIDLPQRIRDAVAARLGAQVDAGLLDVIIRRVMAGTGVK
jgi:hypothetical protein